MEQIDAGAPPNQEVVQLSDPSGHGNKQEMEESQPKFFECANCELREEYEYFGKEPPYTRKYQLNEDCYVIEDPFLPPKQGEFIILGAHCQDCQKMVCKDSQCSFYYDGTFCIPCIRSKRFSLPAPVQEKLNKVVII